MLNIDQLFAKAAALHRAGRPVEAEPLYRQILAFEPRHVDSLHLLGVAAYDAGRNQEAFDLIRKAIVLNDRVADFHCNMGLVLAALGRVNEAVAHYQRAIALEPRHAFSYNNLGNTLANLGNMEEAEARLRRAIDLNPNYAEAHYNLANALGAQNKLEMAVAHYRQALALMPNLVIALNNLGTTLIRQGKADEAAAQFRQVIQLEAHNAGAYYNLGNILRGKLDYAAAIVHYKQALALRPDYADAWNNMGAAFAEQGDIDASREAYQKAVEADPTRAAYHRNLASSKRFEFSDDPQLLVMEKLALDTASVPESERMDLQFALGKAYADLKQHDRSFLHFLAGNRLKRAQIAYSEPEALTYMRRISEVFDAELLRAKAGSGDLTATPVFIVGMPRSGTTLIEQIIASHPNAVGAGELFDLDNIVQSLARTRDCVCFPEIVKTMSGSELRQIGARYIDAIRAIAPAAERVADKMPWNFHFLGLIHLAMPNARIIHARRDPVDTCLSCFSILFEGDSNCYTYDLDELGRFYRAYENLMTHWRAVLPEGVMIEVQYEDVVADLENQARRIIAHCGLAWNDACLAFHKTRRPVRTSSVAQVRQPIYRSSIGRWRPYRKHLRSLLFELGINANDDSCEYGTARAEQEKRAI
jgi:tetratricopeptide (TPR) repeat protein